jgi:hypothetical protein
VEGFQGTNEIRGNEIDSGQAYIVSHVFWIERLRVRVGSTVPGLDRALIDGLSREIASSLVLHTRVEWLGASIVNGISVVHNLIVREHDGKGDGGRK